MGELKNKRIVQSRVFMDGHDMSLPNYDYEFTYPVTVYDAVKKTMDDNSATLTDELEAIYNLLRSKQPLIEAGKPGRIMTWSGVQGDIGSLDVARSIDKNPVNRSHSKIPTERAVGEQLDLKASVSDLHNHIQSRSIHITDVERAKWNSQISAATFNSHVSNTRMHISDAERRAWNAKADVATVEDHVNNFNNPHNVTAHQAGTYTREEIDAHFKSLRETFFNYVNIAYDDRTGVATVHSYDPNNWNPNYVLSFSQALPDVLDTTATYFAIRPATDYKVNETADVVIYRKAPGLNWLEVGSATMKAGDMFIAFPSTAMYVWMQGRFIQVFADSAADEDNLHGNIWYPKLDDKCELSWVLSKETTPPTPKIIKGADGYTPIKGVDYVDGKDGEGVPAGGVTGEFLTKQSDTNYDTAWKSPEDIFTDFVAAGKLLPKGLVRYSDIEGAPKAYTGLGENDDGYITQAGVTKEFQRYDNTIVELQGKVDGPTGSQQTRTDLFNHINDYNNPHRITAEQIGSVSTVTYNSHITDFNNPHNVTAAQIGLDRVNNTADADKPISAQTQLALDRITSQINQINDGLDGSKYISSAEWDPLKSAIIFTRRDGNKVELVLPIADTFGKITFDSATSELVIPLPDGTKNRINISSMIRVYNGSTSENIQVTVGDDKVIRATVIPGTIGEFEIAPNVNLRESPTTTTQAVSDRTTKIATTEYVKNQVINNLISYDSDRPLSANMGRVLNQTKADTKDVIALINDIELTRVIDSLESLDPTAALSANMGRYLDLIKAPRVHTSPSGSTYGQATADLFGHVRASEVDPLMDGIVWQGTDDGRYARADHRHPTDITRAPIQSPHFTGEPKTDTPPDNSNDKRIANTEWVRRNIISAIYCVCDTNGNDPNKIATVVNPAVPNFPLILQTGTLINVRFKNTLTVNNPKMNVQGTGAAPMIFQNQPLVAYDTDNISDHLFVYDGFNWRLINKSSNSSEALEFPKDYIGDTYFTPFDGYTTDEYDGTTDTYGAVTRALISIKYNSTKLIGTTLEISNHPSHWALAFGDGSIIHVKDPLILAQTKYGATVRFTLTSEYPSNSPCILIMRHRDAYIRVSPIAVTVTHIPVTSIANIPTSIKTGEPFNLNLCYALPPTASYRTIVWSIANAGTTNATITNNILQSGKSGTVQLKALIKYGLSESQDYVVTKSINIISSGIVFTKQPVSNISVDFGHITEKLTVAASSSDDILEYQWYYRDTATDTPVTGANSPTFNIPANLAKGTYRYFCRVSVKDDPSHKFVDSIISTVTCLKKATNVAITNKPTRPLLTSSTYQLQVTVTPSDANSHVRFTSSNPSIAEVLDNGTIIIGSLAGTSTIKAIIDGVEDSFLLTVAEMVQISSITGIQTSIESGKTITLNPVISPSNATFQNIVWSIANANTNIATITDGNKLKVEGSGKVVIRATVLGDNGYKYTQDFELDVTAAFVPVTNVTFDFDHLFTGIPGTLGRTVIPANATNTSTIYEIISGTGRIVGNTLVSDTVGTIKLRIRIKNGKANGTDFTKDFDIDVRKSTPRVLGITTMTTRITTATSIIPIVISGDATDLKQYDVTVTSDLGTATFDYDKNEITLKITNPPISTTNIALTVHLHDKNNIYADSSYRLFVEYYTNNIAIEDIQLDTLMRYLAQGYSMEDVYRSGNENIIDPIPYPSNANFTYFTLTADPANTIQIDDKGNGTWELDPDKVPSTGGIVTFTIDAVLSVGGNDMVVKSKRFTINIGEALPDITKFARKAPVTKLEINKQYNLDDIVEYEPSLSGKTMYTINDIPNNEGDRIIKFTDSDTATYISSDREGYAYLVLSRSLSTKYPVPTKDRKQKSDFDPIQVLKITFHDPNRIIPEQLHFTESNIELKHRDEQTYRVVTKMNIEDSANNQINYDDWDIVNITSTVPTNTPNTTNYDPAQHGDKFEIEFNGIPGNLGNPIPITVTATLRDTKKINEDITITKLINATYVTPIPHHINETSIYVHSNGSEFTNDKSIHTSGGAGINYSEWEILSVSATNPDIPTLSVRAEMSGPPANSFKIITKSTNPIAQSSVANTQITIVLKHKHGLPNVSITHAFRTHII